MVDAGPYGSSRGHGPNGRRARGIRAGGGEDPGTWRRAPSPVALAREARRRGVRRRPAQRAVVGDPAEGDAEHGAADILDELPHPSRAAAVGMVQGVVSTSCRRSSRPHPGRYDIERVEPWPGWYTPCRCNAPAGILRCSQKIPHRTSRQVHSLAPTRDGPSATFLKRGPYRVADTRRGQSGHNSSIGFRYIGSIRAEASACRC